MDQGFTESSPIFEGDFDTQISAHSLNSFTHSFDMGRCSCASGRGGLGCFLRERSIICVEDGFHVLALLVQSGRVTDLLCSGC